MSRIPPHYDTIVIGLGAAGTAASTTLARAGLKVLALEAMDRVGGRVCTKEFGEGKVELGAEWIHGTEKSIVYDTAILNNISLIPQPLTFSVFYSNNEAVHHELVNELMNFCLAAVEDPPSKPEPLGLFITNKLKAYLQEKHPKVLEDKEFLSAFLEFMNLVINNYEASNDWNDVSAWSKYEELGGEQHMSWHKYGYKTFFELLLNTYNNGTGIPTLQIKLNAEVTQIKWPQDTKDAVKVTCKDGSEYTADNVIVTVSLGVLKDRHATLFSPVLPQAKISAIDKIPIGVELKVILSFEKRWRDPHLFWNMFFWTQKEIDDLSIDDKWMAKANLISQPNGCENCVTVWMTGDAAKRVETLPEDVVKRKCMDLLRTFMGKNVTIPEPTGIIRSSWHSNPFTRGSYTYDNLAVAESPSRSTLAEPLTDNAGKPRVLFAGEATNEFHYSTVHGAADTGLREANRLLPKSKI